MCATRHDISYPPANAGSEELRQDKSRAPDLRGLRGHSRFPGARAFRAALVALLCLSAACAAEHDNPRPDTSNNGAETPQSQIVMLGTGTPLAESNRSGPSVAVIVANTAYLVDFGPSVVRQASAAWKLGVPALEPWRLRFAFATHLHSDHTTGLADLALAPWTLGRDNNLELFGPPGIAAMAEHIISAYEEDIRIRSGPLSFRPRAGSGINAHEIEPGIVLTTPHLTVEAFPVNHGSWKHAYGYRFDTPDRSIVISGDTRPSESLVAKATGCDVLIHEAYLTRTFNTLDSGLRDYHSAAHTSGDDLGKLAARIKPGLLIVYHTLLFGGTEEELLREIQRGFDGQVVVANDLDIF